VKVLTCPKDATHKLFSVMAHVTEEWIVDKHGEFIEKGSVDVGDVTHRPSIDSTDFHFVCDTCGESAVTIEEDVMSGFADFCKDHIEHFNVVPCEFEYEGTVYGTAWCWDAAVKLGLTKLIKEEE
jgi:hypothetical protein